MSLFSSKKGIAIARLSTVAFLAIAATSTDARAEELKVFANQYVVEYRPTAAAFTTSDLATSSAPVQTVRTLGSGTSALITTKPRTAALGTSAISGESQVVDYNAANDECAHLIKTGKVASCSPNYVLNISAPNDPQLGALWGLGAAKGIDAARGWEISTGSSDIVVAVIDTGIDYTHPDLAANMWTNPGEVAGNNIDDDHNGYVDDVHGISAIARSGNPLDDNGHGSHCAGTIGGVGNNGVGVTGINWNVKMMGLKFLSASGSGSLAAAIEAINYMVDMKNRGVNVRVSSNSWGGGGFSQSLATAIKRATDAGIVFIAAAGNEANNNDQNPSYPAGYDGVVSIAAIDQNRNMATFSNYGASSVDLAAPGVGIVSTYSAGRYATLSGTSMATPHVSGAMALLFAANPGLSAGDAINRLYNTGLPLSSLDGVVRTGRMLNLGRLMHNESSPIPDPTPTPAPCGFTASAIPFASDSAVENAQVILQGDELNFQRVDLPFSFPFSGSDANSITVSPNGLIYVDRSPQTMDYQNSEKAPASSIAALHADLIMDGSLGARVLVESEKVSVYWLAEQYSMRGKGQIGVRAVIHKSGTIETFISFSTSEVESYMQERATMGVTGANESFFKTFAYNNSAIHNAQAVQYSPSCSGGSNPPAGSVTLTGLKVRDARTGQREVTPGKVFQVVLNAQGTGSIVVPITISLDGKACQVSASKTITPGKVKISSRLPRPTQYYRRVSFASGSIASGARINSTNSVRRASRREVRRARANKFAGACEAVARAIR